MFDDGKGFVPMCQRSCGCPIEDLASDLEVNNYWAQFNRAKQLYEMNGISSLLESTYQDLELLDDPQALFELENMYIKIQNQRIKDKEQQDAWNKIMK
jgi:hypothetical protein